MKKKVVTFSCVSVFVVGVISLLIFCLLSCNGESNMLYGNKIDDYVYIYDLGLDTSSLKGYYVKGEDIYYLKSSKKINLSSSFQDIDYILQKINIYSGKITTINSLTKRNDYCVLEDKYVVCVDEFKEEFYDLNLKKVLSHESSMELDNRYIPYHNDFIKLLEGEIVLNEKVEEIKGFYSELMFQDYLALDDNTYLLFYDNKTLNYSIYDIKNREFKNTGEKNYSKYQDGFIFYDDNHYQIYNLKDNVERRYLFKNTIEEELYYYYSYFTSSRDNIVQYNDRKNILEIINLKSNQIYGLDFSNYSMGKISGLSMNNNLLYLSVYNDRTDIDEFFIIDIQKLLEKGLDVDTYIKKFTDNQEKKIDDKISDIKDKYKVNVKIKEEVNKKYNDFTAELLMDNYRILDALDYIEYTLEKFPSKFFDNFYDHGKKGLTIYVSGTLKPMDLETQVEYPVAYFTPDSKEYRIVVDFSDSIDDTTLCHEIMHGIENNLDNKTNNSFKKWNSLNPKDFDYAYFYKGGKQYNYSLLNEDNNKVYFTSEYSFTFPMEDRAEILGYLCTEYGRSDITKYPHLYNKAKYLRDELAKYYDGIEDSYMFSYIR